MLVTIKLLVLGVVAALVAVGVTARTARVSVFYAGTGRLHPALNGLAIAASAMPAALLASMPGVLPFGRQDDASLFVGVSGGLLLIALLLAAPLRRFAGYTLPDFLAERFQGGDARILGILAIFLCSLPLLVAMLWIASDVGALAFGVDRGGVALVASAILFVAALPGGMRSVSIMQVFLGGVLIAGVALAAIVLYATGVKVISPYAVMSAPLLTNARTSGDWSGEVALAIALALGTASLPHLLMRSITPAFPRAAAWSFAWALVFVAPLYFAPLAFRAGFALLAGGGAGAVSGAVVASFASVAIVAASLTAAAGLALAMANALSYDVYYQSVDPSATPQRRLLAARACLVAVMAVAAGFAARADAVILPLAGWCVSLAASGILPVLALGLWWQRANRQGAVAGMVAGIALCLYYLVAPRYIPITFYETSSFFSNATPDDAARYLALKQAYALAEGAAKAAALSAFEAQARALANWGGVSGVCAALFAAPVAFLVTIVASLLTPAPSADVQRFVEELGHPVTEKEETQLAGGLEADCG